MYETSQVKLPLFVPNWQRCAHSHKVVSAMCERCFFGTLTRTHRDLPKGKIAWQIVNFSMHQNSIAR